MSVLREQGSLMIHIDQSGRIIDKSPGTGCLLGYDDRELVGEDAYRFIHPEDVRKAKEALDLALQNTVTRCSLQIRFKHKGGGWHEMQTLLSATEPGTAGLRVEVNIDSVSEESVSSRTPATRSSHGQTIDITGDGIWVQDLEQQIIFWSKGAGALYGWSEGDIPGKSARGLFNVQWLPEYEAAWRKTLERGEWSGVLNQVTRSGEEIIVESRWTLIRDAAGAIASVLAVNSDMTQKIRLENQARRSHRIESLGSLSSAVAHDLNNLFTPILTSIRLLEKKVTDDDGIRLVQNLRLSAQRGSGLVRQLLTYGTRSVHQRLELQLHHLVREIEFLVTETFPRSITIHTTYDRDLPAVLGDPTEIYQVLLNLCINARDAMPEGGEIRITLDTMKVRRRHKTVLGELLSGTYIRLQISDTGQGIPPKHLSSIFQPMFTTKGPDRGTGQGLAIVAGIVDRHNGAIDVKSRPGKGSRFTVYFPAGEARAAAPAEETATEAPTAGGEMILVIDDEAVVREVVSTILKHDGYQVLTANDGREGVSLYSKTRSQIGAVILDIEMPVMSGREVIEEILKLDPGVKVLAISGLRPDQSAAKALGSVMSLFLQKPFTSEALLRALKDLLQHETTT